MNAFKGEMNSGNLYPDNLSLLSDTDATSQHSDVTVDDDVSSSSEGGDLVRELLTSRRAFSLSMSSGRLSAHPTEERECDAEKKAVTSSALRGAGFRSFMVQSYSDGDFRRRESDLYAGETLKRKGGICLGDSSSIWSSRQSSPPSFNSERKRDEDMNRSRISLQEIEPLSPGDDEVFIRDQRRDEEDFDCCKVEQPKRTKGLPVPVQMFKSNSDRDPENIHEDLKVDFGDVIAEPDGFLTPKVSWNLSREIFTFGRGSCYTISSFVFAIPAALLWGVWFALLTCANVWLLEPLRRSHVIQMRYLGALWRDLVAAILDPLFRSCSKMFDRVREDRGAGKQIV